MKALRAASHARRPRELRLPAPAVTSVVALVILTAATLDSATLFAIGGLVATVLGHR